MIPLGYSTYATQRIDVFEALPKIRSIGYEAIEIAIGDAWPTTPDKLDRDTRRKLSDTVQALGFPPPTLFGPVSTCARDDNRPAMLNRFTQNCALACDLNFQSNPAIITTTLSGPVSNWDTEKETIASDLLELARIAADHNTILSVEPHVGGVFDTPEKAAWLMQYTHHPNLKIHFDHSHFHVQGIDLQHAADLCLPHTVHLHIKDGYMKNGKVTFLLPGEGSLDLVTYIQTLHNAGITIPIGAEVSAMIWNLPNYNPWPAAESCYRALDNARRKVISRS